MTISFTLTSLQQRASSASRMTDLSYVMLKTSKSWCWGSMRVCSGKSVSWTYKTLEWLLRIPRLCWSLKGSPLSTPKLFSINTKSRGAGTLNTIVVLTHVWNNSIKMSRRRVVTAVFLQTMRNTHSLSVAAGAWKRSCLPGLRPGDGFQVNGWQKSRARLESGTNSRKGFYGFNSYSIKKNLMIWVDINFYKLWETSDEKLQFLI